MYKFSSAISNKIKGLNIAYSKKDFFQEKWKQLFYFTVTVLIEFGSPDTEHNDKTLVWSAFLEKLQKRLLEMRDCT